MTDALAVGFRQVTKALDWALGDRIGRDFTATAAECYEVAAPAAGYILEQIPETGPLAGIEQRAGLVGAAFALLGYGARVSFRRPGGNAEADELKERVVRRMARAKARERSDRLRVVDGPEPAPDAPDAAPPARAPTYGDMLGIDEDTTLDDSGPL